MALTCTAPPLVEPVQLSELKDMLRMSPTDTSQDDVLMTLERAACSWVEAISRRRLVQQSWQLSVDYFPGYIDSKISGSKVSAPYISGANAVLVGIRYAFELPYPPAQSIQGFTYLNANGLTSSMIVGPENIGGVTNATNGPVIINTTTPHGLITGSTANISGNSALVALIGTASPTITVIDPNDFSINGSVGTGTSISATGSITGLNYVQDLLSQPARLSPIFGQMWPVARVALDAVQINWTVGYAVPVTVSTSRTSAVLTGGTFTVSNVGQPILIPGAGASPGASAPGGALNTIIASVNGSGVATVRDAPLTAVENVTALLVAYGTPGNWDTSRLAIKFLVNKWYVDRMPNMDSKTRAAVVAILTNCDLRV